jgi:hypothetical protein
MECVTVLEITSKSRTLMIWQKWEQLDDEGIYNQKRLDDFVGEL